MSNRRGLKPKTSLAEAIMSGRSSSAKLKPCSDRIIQLALPNLHIVSSVLKDHFRTLSRNHVQRLENLLDHIKTTKSTISQINFTESFGDFKDCEKNKIVEVLDGVHGKKKISESGREWRRIKFLPVKSSSDTFLMGLDKKTCFYTHRSDRSSTDSSSNVGTYKGVFKKAVASMNFNYKETVYIKLEGFKSRTEQNSKLVQTDNIGTKYCETCSKGNNDIEILYMQKPTTPKKKKIRQLHTLLENNDFLRNNVNNALNKIKYDKYIQVSQRTILLQEDIELTIRYLNKFYLLIVTKIQLLFNIYQESFWYSCEMLIKFLVYSLNVLAFMYYCSLEAGEKAIMCVRSQFNITKGKYKFKKSEQYIEETRKRKKRKNIYSAVYQFKNLQSIIH